MEKVNISVVNSVPFQPVSAGTTGCGKNRNGTPHKKIPAPIPVNFGHFDRFRPKMGRSGRNDRNSAFLARIGLRVTHNPPQ